VCPDGTRYNNVADQPTYGATCCGGRLAARCDGEKARLVAHQELMLWRDVRRLRPGGEGACVTSRILTHDRHERNASIFLPSITLVRCEVYVTSCRHSRRYSTPLAHPQSPTGVVGREPHRRWWVRLPTRAFSLQVALHSVDPTLGSPTVVSRMPQLLPASMMLEVHVTWRLLLMRELLIRPIVISGRP